MAYVTAGDGIRTHDVQLGKQPGSNVTDDSADTCECQAAGPAYSPDSCGATAFADAELRSVVTAWPVLPEPIRRAIMALVGAVASSSQLEISVRPHENAAFRDARTQHAG